MSSPRRRWWTSTRRTPPQHRAGADRVTAGAEPRLPVAGLPGARRAARARRQPVHRQSAVIGAAGNASQSTIMIDGVDFTDPVLAWRARVQPGGDQRVPRHRQPIRHGDRRVGGGALSIVTKSGRTRYTAPHSPSPRRLAAREGKYDLKKNDYSRQQFGGTIGGPITKDKVHFFVPSSRSARTTSSVQAGHQLRVAGGGSQGAVRSVALLRGLDTRLSDDQNLRFKFVYERYRQDNFRVGGVVAEQAGMKLDRDNYNFSAPTRGRSEAEPLISSPSRWGRQFDEPNNSTAMAEYFSSGTTLQIGANIVATRTTPETCSRSATRSTCARSGAWAQDLKFGGAWQYVKTHGTSRSTRRASSST